MKYGEMWILPGWRTFLLVIARECPKSPFADTKSDHYKILKQNESSYLVIHKHLYIKIKNNSILTCKDAMDRATSLTSKRQMTSLNARYTSLGYKIIPNQTQAI